MFSRFESLFQHMYILRQWGAENLPPPTAICSVPPSNTSKIYVTDLISKSVFHNIIIIRRTCIYTRRVSLLFFNNKLLLLRVALDENISRPNLTGRRRRRRRRSRLLNYVHRPFRALFIHVRFLSLQPVRLRRSDAPRRATLSYWISVKKIKNLI